MDKVKCIKCGKTLLLMDYGKIEIKCPRCGHIEKIEHNEVKSKGEHRE